MSHDNESDKLLAMLKSYQRQKDSFILQKSEAETTQLAKMMQREIDHVEIQIQSSRQAYEAAKLKEKEDNCGGELTKS